MPSDWHVWRIFPTSLRTFFLKWFVHNNYHLAPHLKIACEFDSFNVSVVGSPILISIPFHAWFPAWVLCCLYSRRVCACMACFNPAAMFFVVVCIPDEFVLAMILQPCGSIKGNLSADLGLAIGPEKYTKTRSLGALRAPNSSWRPFGPLDFILRAQAVWPMGRWLDSALAFG